MEVRGRENTEKASGMEEAEGGVTARAQIRSGLAALLLTPLLWELGHASSPHGCLPRDLK